MENVNWIACFFGLCTGYLLGTSNMAYFISKLKGVDLRKGGSGNLGTSNATILLGKRIGFLVFLHDFFKAVLAVMLCKWIFPDEIYAPYIAGVACVLGHIFPFYLHFKGGKGFASLIGFMAAVDFTFALITAVLLLIISFICDWIVAGTLFTIVVLPLYLAWSTESVVIGLITLVASCCIFGKHVENLFRKVAGKEIGMRTALKNKKNNKN